MAATAYEVSVPIQVRWRDLDPLGHVNNAVYLSLLEMARVGYFKALFGAVAPKDFNIIIARIEIDYLAPIGLLDEPVCHIAVAEAGEKSFVFQYLLVDGEGGELARARSVQVMFDYESQRSIPIPDGLWQRIVALKERRGVSAPARRS